MSGRPEKPVAADAPEPVRELALRLRGMRAAAGMTLAELSASAGCGRATVSRVLAGRQVPNWPVVEGLARATHATVQEEAELRQLWHDAAVATHRTTAKESASGEVLPGAIEVYLAFQKGRQRATLEGLYDAAGRPTVREMAERTRLSRSAVHRALTGQSTAGADTVAHSLIHFVRPKDRDYWDSRVRNVFSESAPSPQAPLFQATPAAGSEADQAFAEFLRSLRQVRNLIAHGQVETDPQFAAHVLELAALVRPDRRRPALGGTKPEPDSQAHPLPTAHEVLPDAIVDGPEEEPADEPLASDPTPGRRAGA